MDLSLDHRNGLPEALRVLAEALPREGWREHRNFDELTRFWLDRHLMFRNLLQRLRDGAEARLDARADPLRHARELQRYGSMLLSQLHQHHHIEDDHYFPQLQGLDPRLEQGFAILDADHRFLDGHIHALADLANAHLRTNEGQGTRETLGTLHSELSDFEGFLDRHLTDEEDLVVPVILTHAPLLT